MFEYYELLYFVKKYADSNWKLNLQFIPFCDLTFILEGEAVYISGNDTFVLKSGDAVFLPEGSQRYALTKGMQCVAFNFRTNTNVLDSPQKITWHNDPMLNTYFNEFNKAWHTKTNLDKMKCDGLFRLILSRVLELHLQGQENPYINLIKDYIHKHYTEKITVHGIAAQVNLNPVYCGALFSAETGDTILNYTNRLRIVRAKELLQCTNDPISQIANEVGIEDLFYFSRLFKKQEGMAPQQFRKHISASSNHIM